MATRSTCRRRRAFLGNGVNNAASSSHTGRNQTHAVQRYQGNAGLSLHGSVSRCEAASPAAERIKVTAGALERSSKTTQGGLLHLPAQPERAWRRCARRPGWGLQKAGGALMGARVHVRGRAWWVSDARPPSPEFEVFYITHCVLHVIVAFLYMMVLYNRLLPLGDNKDIPPTVSCSSEPGLLLVVSAQDPKQRRTSEMLCPLMA